MLYIMVIIYIYILFYIQHVEVLFILYNYLSVFWLDISEFNEKSKRRVDVVFGKHVPQQNTHCHGFSYHRPMVILVIMIIQEILEVKQSFHILLSLHTMEELISAILLCYTTDLTLSLCSMPMPYTPTTSASLSAFTVTSV